jgi:hypothetical protein
MNERIQELAFEAADGMLSYDAEGDWRLSQTEAKKFAALIVRECIDTLLWHGCDDAVPYIEWMAGNKLGVKQ